ncbi:hypothetical protein [uncultured Croceitalea sp.]|uniref:hypothetical protein n=1 Tax=uncultured Croceitalea sp. TaxID=1798908 RepID=UPI003305FF91
MTEHYIPLRVNRDFGDIVTTYFDFFKQNIKKFTNVFLSYNGIFLIGLLIVSYLLVSGFMGVIAYENSYTYGVAREPMDEKYFMLVGLGGILFLVIFIMVAVLNYGLASSYMIQYETNKGRGFTKKQVWNYVKGQFGNVVLFIILAIPIFLAYLIISVIFAFIPLVGIFVNYTAQFFMSAWLGVSFFDMLQNKKGVTDAFGEGWNLVTKNFWRSIGVNFVLGLLIGILTIITFIVPGVIVGVYTFHVVENEVAYSTSIVATIVYTMGTCLFLVILVYGQCLSQFVNGILYYALHEKTYNIHTRGKIEQIGSTEQ